jgi:hypothetical protein
MNGDMAYSGYGDMEFFYVERNLSMMRNGSHLYSGYRYVDNLHVTKFGQCAMLGGSLTVGNRWKE